MIYFQFRYFDAIIIYIKHNFKKQYAINVCNRQNNVTIRTTMN